MITVGTFLPSRIIKFTYLFISCLGSILLRSSLVSEVTALILHSIITTAAWLPGLLAAVLCSLHCSVFTCIYYDHSPLFTLHSPLSTLLSLAPDHSIILTTLYCSNTHPRIYTFYPHHLTQCWELKAKV